MFTWGMEVKLCKGKGLVRVYQCSIDDHLDIGAQILKICPSRIGRNIERDTGTIGDSCVGRDDIDWRLIRTFVAHRVRRLIKSVPVQRSSQTGITEFRGRDIWLARKFGRAIITGSVCCSEEGGDRRSQKCEEHLEESQDYDSSMIDPALSASALALYASTSDRVH